ncbi:RNA polymerase, sigma-24 subunit, ECF subfamily [Desulfonispora thiosulfatigenes DSM 11270]|uniref:RNA polymerase, sigma-24 subunit, ECF subfamily n=1 Tax=Desulfonispora thiosulfatigenes DSM 11270 TaxID=656914 RepID=A0A1W1VQI1_DESTI|nr:sigma-70 region 4 domain-containing protein [Desulfonispora thiosulfatigenes]SMB95523.1 RNA polymerase, sigma-24 subunit, ECF subfamily [Desulfonispora thiosulfatigenes DSM 11270]
MKGFKDITKNDVKNIIFLRTEEGKSIREISKVLNIKYGTVHLFIKRNVPKKEKPKPICPICKHKHTVNEVISCTDIRSLKVYYCKECLIEIWPNGEEREPLYA